MEDDLDDLLDLAEADLGKGPGPRPPNQRDLEVDQLLDLTSDSLEKDLAHGSSSKDFNSRSLSMQEPLKCSRVLLGGSLTAMGRCSAAQPR